MVYCTKCGTSNADDAKVCVNCGTPLYGGGSSYTGRVRYERRYDVHRRGSLIAGLIIGVIVIFIGLSFLLQAYDIPVPWWEILLVIFGVYLVALWFRAWNRRK